MSVHLNIENLPKDLAAPVKDLCRELGIRVSGKGEPLTVRKGNSLRLNHTARGYSVTYPRRNELFWGLSQLSDVAVPGYIKERKAPSPEMLCYMADASRDAVPSVEGTKKLIRLLAAMGYDSLMLYTEDTYEIPEYPYFGHMRGRYTETELKELDDYAFSFGIELIPCIQTLAHLGTAIRWPDLGAFSDTGEILLAGDDRTYEFVRRALSVWKRCIRSRRVNLGMDEAHALGLGRYLGKNGYKKPAEIMREHLSRVAAICGELGFSPMIWSDMFFRTVFKGAYRVRTGEVPQEIRESVPANVSLIYWDYYSLDRQIFDHMVEEHQKFPNEVLFAGGAWKWSGFAPHNRFSLKSTELQLDSCAEHGLSKVIVTGWGDNGGEASQFSTLPVLLYFAERLYCGEQPGKEQLNTRAKQLFGMKYDDLLLLDLPNNLDPEKIVNPVNPCKYLLFNDPLEGLFDKHMKPDVSELYALYAEKLLSFAGNKRWGYLFRTLGTLCDLLSLKADLGLRLCEAYRNGDREELGYLAEEVLPAAVAQLDDFTEAFRAQWFAENKSFGFSVHDVRFGGLRARLIAASERVTDYLSGKADRLEELEQPRLWMDGRADDSEASPYINYNGWTGNAMVGRF